MSVDRCVCCGAVIPEGLQVCGMCSAGGRRQEDEMSVINRVWHDVQLDPPQREGSYLAATDRGGVVIAHWYPNKNLDGTVAGGGRFSGYHGHITHWMDRPEPPGGWKEKKEKTFRGRQKPHIRKRNLEIWELYQSGRMTQKAIGRRYGITASTVHFILKDVERMKRHGLI